MSESGCLHSLKLKNWRQALVGQLRAGKVNLLEYFSFIRPQTLFAESLAVLGCVCLTFKEYWERIELFKTYGKRTKDGHYKRQVLISRRLGALKKKHSINSLSVYLKCAII